MLSNNEIFLEDVMKNSEVDNSMIYYYKDSCSGFNTVTYSIENIELFELLMQLTEIERDIIHCILKGYKINEIAKMKVLSDKTIRKYRNLAFKKLELYL